MNTEKNPNNASDKSDFHIESKIRLVKSDCQPGEIKLVVYAFDKLSSLTGWIRQSFAYQQTFSAKDWRNEGGVYHLRADIALAKDIWWPWLHKWWDVLLVRLVLRIPDLLQERTIPKPFPEPDPAPDLRFSSVEPGVAVSLNPQLLPPGLAASSLHFNQGDAVSFNPQPDPPALAALTAQTAFSRVGNAIISGATLLAGLTTTSTFALRLSDSIKENTNVLSQ
jgi:hypothetical protein